MRVTPLHWGIAFGYALPLFVVGPALFWGDLVQVLADHRTYYLLPSMTLLAFPSGLAGYALARVWAQRRDAWRFGLGAFVGASAAAALLFWAGGAGYPLRARIVTAVFGGPLLAGFWVWLGLLLGSTLGYARRERLEAEDAPPRAVGDGAAKP